MGKLTIQEIAAILVEKNGFAKRDAVNFASAMFALIQERLETDQLVKVKGLGTFKLIDVEARESISVRTGERVTIGSHTKVSFIPDATMKELVNKPFSQFETVVLNDGVVFDDLNEGTDEEALAEDDRQKPQPIQPLMDMAKDQKPSDTVDEPAAEVVQTPVPTEEDEPVAEEEPASFPEETEEELAAEEEPAAEDEPTSEQPVETNPDDSEEGEDNEEKPDDEPVVADDEEKASSPIARRLLGGLGIITLMAASAFGGYYYGSRHAQVAVVADTVLAHDTVTVVPIDTISPDTTALDQPDVKPEPQQPATKVPEVAPVATPAKPQATVPSQETSKPKTTAEPLDQYAQKDERVRLGAYRIVGLEREVKVLAGQTFYSICRAHLGPDMECYVEVFNNLPQNPKIKEGQVIKIPKLQLKKRRR